MLGEQCNGVCIQNSLGWSIAGSWGFLLPQMLFARISTAKLQIYCNTDQQLLNNWIFQTYNCLSWFNRSSNVMNAISTSEVHILAHMVTRVAFLCMETLPHPRYISENWGTRLEIQLRALCEVGRLAIARSGVNLKLTFEIELWK